MAILKFTYQFDGYPVVRDEVGREVYAAVGSLSEHVHQLISFAQDSGNLSLHVNEFTIHVRFVARVGCARRLLSGTGNTVLPCTHLVARVRTLPGRHHVVRLVPLPWRILDAGVNGVVLFLLVCRVAQILSLVRCSALKITALIIEMLEH